MSFNPAVAVLVLVKGLATPIVLYTDSPYQFYDELKEIIAKASPAAPRLIEKPAQGPLRKVCFLDTELVGVALQVDPALEAQASAPVAPPLPPGGGGGASGGGAPYISFKPSV